MRRIALKDAKPNMQLAAPAYNDFGEMILDSDIYLRLEHVKLLVSKGVSRLIIEDSRVPDLILSPLIPLHIQAEAIKAVFNMMKEVRAQKPGGATIAVQETAYAIAQQIEESIMGDPDIMGTSSLKGYTYIHPVQSAITSMMLAKEAGYDHSDILRVGEAAMLQDIGYALIPQALIEKSGQLTEAEDEELQKHPQYAAQILRQYSNVQPYTVDAVLQHHERWDGSGYPDRKKGWDIPPHAQMVAIADTFCDLISKKPNRQPFSLSEAFEYIMAASGQLFDPELVEVFARRIPMYPSGVMVQLTSGEIGIVIAPNIGQLGRPQVRICYQPNPRDASAPIPVNPPIDIDLSSSAYQQKLVAKLV